MQRIVILLVSSMFPSASRESNMTLLSTQILNQSFGGRSKEQT